ncbi:MAG: putative lipid II flippase FtsW [Microgenomates group bacterium]
MRKINLSLATRIFSMTILLLGFGLIMIYSASVAEGARDFGNKWHFVLLQLKWAGLGLVGMMIVSLIPPKIWAKLAPFLLLIGILLLSLVIIPGIGTKVQGARRWLVIPGITIQPSELMKFIEVVYLSSWLHSRKITLPQFGFFIAISAGLIMLQPDMGTTLVVSLLAIAMYFLSGYPVKHLFSIGAIGLVMGTILIIAEPYRLDRVKTFIDPLHDAQGSSYHIRQVLLSLGSGGVTGLGIGRSRQKYAYLPESTTDSIFAVVGEELGFIGGVTLILAFLYYLSLIFKVASGEHDKFASSMVAGVGAWIGLQVCLNLAAMTALTPLTGVPLPLVSYGGSALITMLGGIGLVLSVARHQKS